MTVDEIVKLALLEDLGDGDHTSLATISSNARGKADLIAKEDGIIAGLEVATLVFKEVDSELNINLFKKMV